MRVRSVLQGFMAIAVVLLISSFALGGPRLIVLDPSRVETKPEIFVRTLTDQNIEVELHLPALEVCEIETKSGAVPMVSIPGEPLVDHQDGFAVPTIRRLLVVPTGAAATTDLRVHQTSALDGLSLPKLPMEEPVGALHGREPQSRKIGEANPRVQIGEPASLRGVSVVPITFYPVAYDSTGGQLQISHHLEVAITFSGDASSAAKLSSQRPVPESFAKIYRENLLGYRTSAEPVGPGSYLVICRNNPDVLAALQPLISWRQRQGYHVAVSQVYASATPTSIKAIIQDAYDSWDVPLEYVLLVGDASGSYYYDLPCWHEAVSGLSGEGDHYYTTLEGEDTLSDIHIGRLSFATLSELETIVTKIVDYETSPYLIETDWFARATLVSDPLDSGISTVFVNELLQERLLDLGFAEIDFINSGPFVGPVMASLNEGSTMFGYRGFWGMSGITPEHLSTLSNGRKLAFATLPTCGTGSFEEYAKCHSEALLRASAGGAVAAVATATGGTHTRYNNCYYNGIWSGLIGGGDFRVGPAHTLGKLELFANYQIAEPWVPEIWSVWNNIMGDPATQVWTAIPTEFTVEHPATLPLGSSAVPVMVTVGGYPHAGARVSLLKANEIQVSAITDAAGRAILPATAYTAGEILVTVTEHNHLPYMGSVGIGDAARFVTLDQVILDDDAAGASSGNGDGVVNPGETVAIWVSLRNLGTQTASEVAATLASSDGHVQIAPAEVSAGDMSPGAVAWASGPFIMSVDPLAPAAHTLQLDLLATDGAEVWTSALELVVHGAAFTVEDFTWEAGPRLEPGEAGSLSLALRNGGSLAAEGISAQLWTDSPWITIDDADASFAPLAPGASGANTGDAFGLDISEYCFGGHLACFTLTLQYNELAMSAVDFCLPVGGKNESDPAGPDGYGYYAFDDTDVGHPYAPVYEWVEIDPQHGGAGTEVGLGDFSWEQDDTQILDLPFTFRYYGQDYDQISVCSNGWLAMGQTELRHYRNFSIPSAGSPGAMIAPYWDNLYQVDQNRVYHWYDAGGHRYIVQWSRMRAEFDDQEQNFQVILHDPLQHETATGDGEIVFQYETVNNLDSRDGYATVGIQNQDRTDGLLYSYWNTYAPGAAPLACGRAIRFMPLRLQTIPTCEVTPDAFAQILHPDETAEKILHLHNGGQPGSLLHYSITAIDPDYPRQDAGAAKRDISGSYVTAQPPLYLPGETASTEFRVFIADNSYDWPQIVWKVELDFPAGVIVNHATHLVGAPDRILWYTGDSGEGATVVWENPSDVYQMLWGGEEASAAVNLTFGEAAGILEIPYAIHDINIGEPPHQVHGTILLDPSGPHVHVIAPNGGEAWALGEVQQVEFLAQGGPETVRVELQRGDGEPWQILGSGVPAAAGSFAWTVAGPLSAGCRIRVTDEASGSLVDTSDGAFTIYRPLNWVRLDRWRGAVATGQTDDIVITFDSAGLPENVYAAELVISNGAGAPVIVPLRLTVDLDFTPVTAEIPPRLSLDWNRPNPFNPWTTISFDLPSPGRARLEVFTVQGERVTTLLDRELETGAHHALWDGRDESGSEVASGVYVYRLQAMGQSLSHKMLLMK